MTTGSRESGRPPEARPGPIEASGILAIRTGFFKRPGGGPRRKLWRPPWMWSVWVLIAAVVVGEAAALHRRSLDRRFAAVLASGKGAPFELQRLRRELSELELDEENLSRELDARMKYIENSENDEFYLVLDTRKNRFSLKFGDSVVREAGLTVGPTRTIESKKGRRWTFAPLTGAFNVKSKAINPAWRAPEWAYVLGGSTPPRPLPSIPGGLGKYVLEISEGYVIHSPPPPSSPLTGAKPGSFLVPEADLAAIWRRIGPETRIYIF